MSSPFDDVCCARIPRESLALMACLRVEPGLRVCRAEQLAWLRWDAGNTRVLDVVMPIHDALLYRFHDGRWHRFGHPLPDFEFPADQRYQALAHVLFPMPAQPIPVPATCSPPLRLILERDDRPRATTAMRCALPALLTWSDTVGSRRLATLQGAVQKDQMLILGGELPIVDNAVRYWGNQLLIPLGYAPSFPLAQNMLRTAIHVANDELVVWEPDRIQAVARALFAPLSRANLRLSMREAQG